MPSHSRSHAARIVFGVFLGVSTGAEATEPARELSLDERVEAHRAIEQVLWRHRLWPQDNAGPKPALSEVLPEAALRAAVEDGVKKSNALETWWRRPITAAQLQAEVERMTRDTRDGAVLRELFDALGNDPWLIAETLARQTLADRLIRSWYANDERFHGDVKRRAETEFARCQSVSCMRTLGGAYSEVTRTRGPSRGDAIGLTDAEWEANLRDLARQVGGSASALRVLQPGTLEETADAFVSTAVLSQSDDEIKTASVVWSKQPFDTWWRSEAPAVPLAMTPNPDSTFALPSAPLGGCADNTWTRTPIESPDPASFHSAVWTGTEMIVWGGYAVVPTNTGGRYTPATDSWVLMSGGANVPSPRWGHSAVWTGTEMIIWGGVTFSLPHNTGARYNPASNAWTPTSVGSNLPSARSLHKGVWTGSRMIVWGGLGNEVDTNTGGMYDPLTDSWSPTSLGPNVPPPALVQTAVWTGSRMIVWGGAAGGRYDPMTNTWTPLSAPPQAVPRTDHTAVWTGTEMIVWGGGTNPGPGQGGRYNPSTDTWHETSTGASAPRMRRSHAAVWTGSVMLVWGGFDGSADLSSGGRYNPATDSWTPTTGVNVPTARSWPTAVWANGEMIVWGGLPDDSTAPFNTGGRYDPSSDTWVPTSTGVTTPRPRQSHTAVWTGSEMIVWGGDTQAGGQSTGGRYSPATNSWTPTSTNGAPSGRTHHTAVWTGTQMLVWGGVSAVGGTLLATGGRYSPTSDAWTPMSVGANSPSPRQWHTAVWASNRMVVWGGQDATGPRGNGGRYDPITNAWLIPVSTSAAPSPRRRHSAIWTGSKMIVWGGGNNVGLFASGGAYNLATNSWSATAPAGAPEGREFHTAVWTGSDMIVWGGAAGGWPLQSGGRYNPSTNTWVETSAGTNVPSPRDHHVAVWTGNEMIVWGGRGTTGFIPLYELDGARYEPAANSWTPMAVNPGNPGVLADPKAVWTGMQMIVWGGRSSNNGGLYCASCTPTTWYQDQDGDGYGFWAGPPLISCAQPGGWVSLPGDCNNADPTVHPGAVESCNRIDDDCDGITDVVGGAPCLQLDKFPPTTGSIVSWRQVPSALSYDVASGSLSTLRSTGGNFTAATHSCLVNNTTATSVFEPRVPPTNDTIFHLVRANFSSGPGTYNEGLASQVGSRDAEIAAAPSACP